LQVAQDLFVDVAKEMQVIFKYLGWEMNLKRIIRKEKEEA